MCTCPSTASPVPIKLPTPKAAYNPTAVALPATVPGPAAIPTPIRSTTDCVYWCQAGPTTFNFVYYRNLKDGGNAGEQPDDLVATSSFYQPQGETQSGMYSYPTESTTDLDSEAATFSDTGITFGFYKPIEIFEIFEIFESRFTDATAFESMLGLA